MLNCDKMDLTAIDVTHNPALSTFSCAYNNLTVLDLSQNPALSTINCGTNNLTVLDVSKNPALRSLTCPNNFITALDLSKNPVFFSLMCDNNALTSLNVANGVNTQFYQFQVYNNPDLRCIEVDDAAWSTSHWSYIDSTAYFSNNCGSTVGLEMQTSINNLSVYPNPTSSQIQISNENAKGKFIIYDFHGKIIMTETITQRNQTIYIRPLTPGIYIWQMENHKGKLVV